MALLTRDQHINEAMEQAGNTGLQTRLETMYPVILRSLYAACPWPFVKRTSDVVVPIAIGDTGFDISPANFYATAGVVVQDGILSINRIALRDSALLGDAWDLDIIHEDEADADAMPLLMPSTRRGRPVQAIVKPKAMTLGTNGVIWRASFNPKPDTALSAVVVANCVPAENVTGAVKPVFQSDELIIQALYVYCLRHQQDERALAELQEMKNTLGAHRAQLKGTSGKAKRLNLSRRAYGGANQQLQNRAWFAPWW